MIQSAYVGVQRSLAFVAVIFMAALSTVSHAEDDVTRNLSELMKVSHERGLYNGNILITKGDEILFENSYGYFSGNKDRMLDSHSVFSIGSIAKEFNAVAIMMLVEEGKISLEDPISKYFPDLPEWAQTIKVKHLLNYTSGLPRVKWDEIKNHEDAFDDLKEVAALPFTPGEGYLYTNNNVFLQRMIIEKVTGQSFAAFATDNILKPLGMTGALVDPAPGEGPVTASFSSEFVDDAHSHPPIEGWVFVTTEDMVKWFTGLHSHQLITKESMNTVFASFSPQQRGAMGEGRYSTDGEITYHRHHGSHSNYEALVTYRKADDISIVLLTNSKSRKIGDVTIAIENILDGKAYRSPKKSFSTVIADECGTGAAACLTAYEKLKANDPDLYDFDNEFALNNVGYHFLSNGDTEGAILIFEKLVSEFPEAANPYDSLGEAYAEAKRFDLALKSYRRAFELNPENTHAEAMIEKIKGWIQAE